MKAKPILTLVALPILAAGYVIFHPGVAFAETPLAKTQAATTFDESGSFTVDPMHTCVGFEIGHLGLSKVQGRFDKLTGKLFADSKNVGNSNVKIVIATNSVDTNVAPRDADLRSPNFFDVTKYPEMTFESTSIRAKDKSYVAEGNLTFHGVTKPISLTFKQYGPIKDPWGNTRIGVVAEPVTIHRSDFGMTFDADSVSNDVVVRISLEATQDKPK